MHRVRVYARRGLRIINRYFRIVNCKFRIMSKRYHEHGDTRSHERARCCNRLLRRPEKGRHRAARGHQGPRGSQGAQRRPRQRRRGHRRSAAVPRMRRRQGSDIGLRVWQTLSCQHLTGVHGIGRGWLAGASGTLDLRARPCGTGRGICVEGPSPQGTGQGIHISGPSLHVHAARERARVRVADSLRCSRGRRTMGGDRRCGGICAVLVPVGGPGARGLAQH